jgi:hypothetical protein
MISLIYVGGLYLTNISEEAIAVSEELQDFITISSTYEDTNEEQFKALEQQILTSDIIEAFGVNKNSYFYKTMLGFRNGFIAYTFSKDDFLRFNQRMQLIPVKVTVLDNTILLSDKQAAFLNVKEGELFRDQTDDIDVYYGEGPFQVIIFPNNAFCAYFVTKDYERAGAYLITWKDSSSKEEYFQKVEELRANYDKLKFVTYEDKMTQFNESFAVNNIVYYSIIAIVSIVFAITTNAVFVGLYDKRKYEFALYQGIGIPKRRIYKKVTTEILCMNTLGLLLGISFSLLVISLLNEGVYHQDGLSMRYYHPTAFFATIFCDLAILIPGIGLRIHRISKEVREVNFL